MTNNREQGGHDKTWRNIYTNEELKYSENFKWFKSWVMCCLKYELSISSFYCRFVQGAFFATFKKFS